ncbi:MAG: hypothetical protein K2Y04_02665 [Caulobacteraceae bacterium]|nr:hypothetical protein [Caulobacteraceae bacterium]
MKTKQSLASVGLAVLTVLTAASPSAGLHSISDAQVRQAIIRQSIASYSGSCPCPYSTARNGSNCGGRSAYSRPGGEAPICYASDVSAAQVTVYRRSN